VEEISLARAEGELREKIFPPFACGRVGGREEREKFCCFLLFFPIGGSRGEIERASESARRALWREDEKVFFWDGTGQDGDGDVWGVGALRPVAPVKRWAPQRESERERARRRLSVYMCVVVRACVCRYRHTQKMGSAPRGGCG
jgi:hypothetical protein